MFEFLKKKKDALKHSKKVIRKRGGIKVKTTCDECGKNSNFHECESKDELKLYGVVKIFDYSKTVMQCENCSATIKALDNPDLAKAFQEREEQIIAREKEQEEEKKRKEEELRRKEFEKKQAQEAREIDDELEQLKSQLDDRET